MYHADAKLHNLGKLLNQHVNNFAQGELVHYSWPVEIEDGGEGRKQDKHMNQLQNNFAQRGGANGVGHYSDMFRKSLVKRSHMHNHSYLCITPPIIMHRALKIGAIRNYFNKIEYCTNNNAQTTLCIIDKLLKYHRNNIAQLCTPKGGEYTCALLPCTVYPPCPLG